MYQHFYDLPPPEAPEVAEPVANKNPDLNTIEQERQAERPETGDKARDITPEQVKAKNRILTSWVKLKMR